MKLFETPWIDPIGGRRGACGLRVVLVARSFVKRVVPVAGTGGGGVRRAALALAVGPSRPRRSKRSRALARWAAMPSRCFVFHVKRPRAPTMEAVGRRRLHSSQPCA